MCSPRPFHQLKAEDKVHAAKGPCSANVAVIVQPAPNHRVELAYQCRRRLSVHAFDALAGFPHQRLRPILGGPNDQLVLVLAHVLAQEVKSRFNMGDGCLLL